MTEASVPRNAPGAGRVFLLAGVTAFWMTMMSWLIQREFFALTPPKAAHEIFPIHTLESKEEYRGIYLGDRRIGFTFSLLEKREKPDEASENLPAGPFELRHNSYLSFLFLGNKRELMIRGKARLDPEFRLIGFETKISSGDYWTELAGKVEGGRLKLLVRGENQPPVPRTIPVTGPVLYSESLNLIWSPRNLSAGRGGRFQVWNPLLTGTEEITFRITKKDSIEYRGARTEVFVVEMDKQGAKTYAWITPQGWMLREESPTGLTFLKEEGYEIFDGMRKSRDMPPDLPNLYSVGASGQKIKDPAAVELLEAEVSMPSGKRGLKTLRSDLTGLDTVGLPVPLTDPGAASYLKPEPLCQSDDPALAAKAREIAGGESSALAVCRRLMAWLAKNMSPVPTVGLPSARQVLDHKKGDCNEYTVLFAAFCRALGIPARPVAGLVYRDGRFFYHAWAEIFLGRWVAADPTFGQLPADAARLALVTGDLDRQVALVGDLGKIRVLLTEVRERRGPGREK